MRERLDRRSPAPGCAFEVTIAGDEVEHGKPAPDMFLLAARAARARAGACVVVEDSPPGVAAGRAAGMPTLGVRRVPGIDLSAATRVVDDGLAPTTILTNSLTNECGTRHCGDRTISVAKS